MTTLDLQPLEDIPNIPYTTNSASSIFPAREIIISEERRRVSAAQMSQAERMVKSSRILILLVNLAIISQFLYID